MAVIESRVNPRSAEFRANAAAMAGLVDDLRAKVAEVERGGGERARERHPGPRQAPPPRPGARGPRPRRPLPGALPARGVGHVRRRRSVREPHHRGRAGERGRVRGHRERRDGEGRDLLPDGGQEAPPGAGGRAGEPPAVHLPRGLGGRVPPPPGPGVPGPRALRAGLLQPGEHVGAGDPPDRGRDGVVHRGRRLRARDVRREHHRPAAGNHLPRGAAAGEGRDRRGGDGGGARRRGRPFPAVRGHRPLRPRRPPRARHREALHRPPQPEEERAPRRARARAPPLRSGRDRGHRSQRPPPALRGSRDHRPDRGREPLPRIQAALRDHPRLRIRAPPRLPRGHSREPGDSLLRVLPQGGPLHRAVRAARHAPRVPPEHHRLHGGAQVRGGRESRRTERRW